jgi:RHS repeat-associated protein
MDAWGNVTSESTPSAGDRYKFQGGQFESNVGQYQMGARQYEPRTGTWTSQDPEKFRAGDSNLYRGMGNNPTNATDPSGLSPLG